MAGTPATPAIGSDADAAAIESPPAAPATAATRKRGAGARKTPAGGSTAKPAEEPSADDTAP